ncbi:MAG: hypothetical protein WKG07_05070 [Hymenobacter sp.]
MELLQEVLKTNPDNFEALCCQASLSLTQHHFAQGLALAEQAQQVNPSSGYVYGLLTDANVELGHYDQAIEDGRQDEPGAPRPCGPTPE